MQIVSITQVRNVRIILNGQVDLLQHLVRLLFRQLMLLLLLILALLAHQDLLELFRQDIDVPGEERKEVGVVKVDVKV